MFLTKRFFLLLALSIFVVACGTMLHGLFIAGCIMAVLLLVLTVVDALRLYRGKGSIEASRIVGDRMSNGDDNEVSLHILSHYPFTVDAEVIDEIPFIFQVRDFSRRIQLKSEEPVTITYTLCPKERGIYDFGHIRVLASTRLRIVRRRFTSGEPQDVKV